jgi:hypothetical protein
MNIDLRISGIMYEALRTHLFPGDGKESVAIALCGLQRSQDSTKVLVHRVIPIPVEDCILRTDVKITWKTDKLIEVLELASRKNFSILKIHSHPTGFPEFSKTDDCADREIFDSAFSWIEGVDVHVSAVMLPDGKLFGRAVKRGVMFEPLNKILVVGSDIKYFTTSENTLIDSFNIRTAQAFGEATTSLLKKLTVGIVGCSGTGSPTIEQVARLGFGKIVMIDPDKVEVKNLNRILNTTMSDAKNSRNKVDVLKKAVLAMCLETEVEAIPANLYQDNDCIRKISECDVLFGCMDSVDGRHLLNQIATFYVIPYFDLGVKLIADGNGGIDQIWATVHYLQPGKSSLLTRGVYTLDDLTAASMYRKDPVNYEALKKEGYIKNVNVESPAVISINMQISSLAVIEFLARIHKFRYDNNADSAITRVSLTDGYIQKESEGETDIYLEKFVGRGDLMPLLNMPEFS